ncbi:unnamed protein product [Effrenium voratum]|nr:unnamed protein product [Effrenium voratum]
MAFGIRRRASLLALALAASVCFITSPGPPAPPAPPALARNVAGLAVSGLALGFSEAASAEPGAAFSLFGKSSAELFPVSNVSLLTWLLLIFAPGWEYLKSAALVAPVINALLYTFSVTYLLAHPAPGDAGLDFGSLGSIVAAFQSPDAVLAGWLHYCVFDPLVGLGEVLDSQKNKIPHVLVVPCLLLTLFFGPMGFLLYLLVRTLTLSRSDGRTA